MNSVFTVTQINTYIGNKLTYDPKLTDISVRGEVSNCKYSSTGHIYFSIKDEHSQISCIMFKNRLTQGGLKFRLENGQAVIVNGSINVYTAGGTYSILADSIEKEGLGELFVRFEKLKEKLAAEGLFDKEHKKVLPEYIRTLGVVTSKTGAVLHDICTVTHRRNPYVRILLSEAPVQGRGAAAELIRALKAMEKAKPDVIIIGRGGGSFEDLFEFNDEALARAVYACSVPIISAVGHETDFTICDLAADVRAATPSVAAELAVFDYFDFESKLVDYEYSLYESLLQKIEENRNQAEQYKLKLDRINPKIVLKGYSDRLPVYEERIKNGFDHVLEGSKRKLESNGTLLKNTFEYKYSSDKSELQSIKDKLSRLFYDRLTGSKHRMELAGIRLDGLSPLKKLQSGYAYVEDAGRHNIRSVSGINNGQTVFITLADGRLRSKVEEVYKDINADILGQNENGR